MPETVVDHTRGLCWEPNISLGTTLEVVEKNPPQCLCCGNEMKVIPTKHNALDGLGDYTILCGFCPVPKSTEIDMGDCDGGCDCP